MFPQAGLALWHLTLPPLACSLCLMVEGDSFLYVKVLFSWKFRCSWGRSLGAPALRQRLRRQRLAHPEQIEKAADAGRAVDYRSSGALGQLGGD